MNFEKDDTSYHELRYAKLAIAGVEEQLQLHKPPKELIFM
jgi:hypothetical protein